MMTDFQHSLSNRHLADCARAMRSTTIPILFVTALLTAYFASSVQAQSIIYHDPYSATTSYPGVVTHAPAISYPTSSFSTPHTHPSTISYPHNRGVVVNENYRVIDSRPLVQRQRSQGQRASVKPKSMVVKPTVAKSKTANAKRAPQREPDTRFASTRRLKSAPRFAVNRSFDDHQATIEPVSPYQLRMIRSARRQAAGFRNTAQTSPAVVAEIAQANADFADQWAGLADAIVGLTNRVDEAKAKLDLTTRDFDDVNAKLTHYGLTPTIGLLLRHKKEQLEEWQVHDSDTLYASRELQSLRQKQLELEMVRNDGADPAGQADAILADHGYDPTLLQNARLVSQLEELLRQRRQWLDSLQQGYQDYRENFGQLDSTATASASLADEYRKLIDRHVIWIRSDDAVSARDLRNLKGGLAAMFDAERSADFGPSIGRKWKTNPVGGIGLLVWIVLISIVRMRAKSWLIGIGNRKRMQQATAGARKVTAGILTTLVALAIPSILYAIGRWLGNGVVSEATLHASSGFYAASLVALMVEVPRQLLRSHGYVHKHAQVDLPRRQRAIAYLTLIGSGLVLAAYMITVMGLIDHGVWRGSVSRFGFMAAMMLVAWTAHLSLKPTGGFLEPLVARFGGSVIHRIRFVIYLVGVGFPLAMMILAALGYGFTANEFIKRAIITLVAALIAATLWDGAKIVSAYAWQMLTGTAPPPRQFDEYGEIEPARNNRGNISGALAEHSLELKHQLAFLCQCALVVGAIVSFGWLWIDVFPNARMGNPVVWTVQETVMQSSVDAAGQAITESVVETTPITAMHLMLAAVTMFVAFQLAKLLPGLWDALVLQRVSFDEGMEHFTLVLGRVVLFGVGCLVACKIVGVRWQTVQWLAVGLTIGLGFGLQDMVRNLFGGLIVLFEKPTRLGDLITVGKVKGRVAAQRFRTTVLSDDEGREVIIPNKKFVSEDVVNWMGAGRLNVIPIEVAVSRDERPADICRTLQELVIDQPAVLLTPAPQATLVCVAKSSQRIEVRAWIEQGQDASRFRDSLLKTVRNFLREKNMLSATQPKQPELRSDADDPLDDSYRSRTNRGRKRSA